MSTTALEHVTDLCRAIVEWKNHDDTWPEMGMGGGTCGDCGMNLTIVRPGKYQCDYCGTLEALAEQLDGLQYIAAHMEVVRWNQARAV